MSEYQFTVPGSRHDERVVIFSRAHPASFMSRVVVFTLLFLLPFVLMPLWLDFLRLQVAILLVCTYYLIWMDLAFAEWVKFYYEFLVVTDHEVIIVQQKGMLDREVYQCHLSQIEESSAHVRGLLPNLFSYGTIVMQTAGSKENVVIENIPNPFEVSERVMKMHHELIRKK